MRHAGVAGPRRGGSEETAGASQPRRQGDLKCSNLLSMRPVSKKPNPPALKNRGRAS